MDVDVTALAPAVDRILQSASANKGAYVCVANVHMCMEAFDSPHFCELINNADLVIPDGKPIAVAQKLLGHKEAAQVRGQDIMHALCAGSGEKLINVGLYGGSSQAILDLVKSNLLAQYPEIKITYDFSPPFRALDQAEDEIITERINQAGVDVLFVGVGCPKQEIWMAAHKAQLNCVMIGVGAAFDFVAGTKKHAPRWMQSIGMEWLFRLCCEPGRLWRRYLKHNPRFVWYFLQQWLFKKNFSRDINGQ
ncbi:MAG: WecB/TagA/CpsF family glycosyltransferase [Porticoccaceae bacterium]|nr:WecB/TagA/CpsF family glycosyltransferase [Porticoccaceae bacterium]